MFHAKFLHRLSYLLTDTLIASDNPLIMCPLLCPGDVRGEGLLLGVEFVSADADRKPDRQVCQCVVYRSVRGDHRVLEVGYRALKSDYRTLEVGYRALESGYRVLGWDTGR